MSATEQMRAMLDGLMGTARDGSDSKRQHLHFTDSRVCRAFLLDCCPHDIFASTKLELGECPKVHDPALRADYILANKTEDYMYEVSASERLQAFVNESDKKTEYLKRKLAETQEELTSEETNKLNRMHDLTESLGKKLAQVDKAEADGDLELKKKFQDESERIKRERALAEAEYKQVSRPASSHQQQNLRVCDVCSAYLGINDNDSRLADHFGGKLHLGFIEVREKLEDLKRRCAEKGQGGDLLYSRDRHYRDRGERDRDRGRDRERERTRDRDRDRGREDKYRDRERDRSHSNNRYYHRDARYDSRPRDSPRDYPPRHRDQVSRDRTSRYRDERIDRDRPDRIERSDRNSAIPQPSSRSSHGPFERAVNASGRYDDREVSYQRRLREWEKRETEKARSYAIREGEEQERRILEEQESKKLKEFFEDYKDDRDDIRFYRGSALARRLADRRKEKERDELARQKEKMELEILSRSCAVGENSTPQPIELAKVNDIAAIIAAPATVTVTTNANATNGELDNYKTDTILKSEPREVPIIATNANNAPIATTTKASTANNQPRVSTSEEKRKQVEELIGRIPTDKEQLFSRKLDWSLLDENLMEKRIRPWVSKKIAEYMGEKEVDLIDFVCTLLNDHKDGYSMLKEVAIVLDDEAEKFVVHMWRLLIFELEAKKIGLRK